MALFMTNWVQITAPSYVPETWGKAVQTGTPLPHSHVIEMHVFDWNWAAVVCCLEYGTQEWSFHPRSAAGEHYLVGINDTGHPFVSKYEPLTHTYEVMLQLPTFAPAEADVKIAFREMRFGDSSSGTFHSVSLWLNSQHYLTFTEEYTDADGVIDGPIYFGLAAPTGQTVTYANVRIPELTTFTDWISLDPSETSIGGLQRAIEGYYLKFFMRHDGALRAWKPKATTALYSYSDDERYNRTIQYDTRDLKTHVRQLGAYTQAEYIRHDLVQRYGHRFAEINNPYLFTEEECYEQAQLAIKRLEERMLTERFASIYHPLLEVEDHIQTPDGERILTSRNVSFEIGSTATEDVEARQYTYGS